MKFKCSECNKHYEGNPWYEILPEWDESPRVYYCSKCIKPLKEQDPFLYRIFYTKEKK